MKIKPLCPELIAKLEIAVARRNRERAIDLIEQAMKPQKDLPPISGETPLAAIFSVKEAAALESVGLLYLGELKRADINKLIDCRRFGPLLVKRIKDILSKHGS